MARLIILGGGITGQTAALHARRKLGSTQRHRGDTQQQMELDPVEYLGRRRIDVAGTGHVPLEPVTKAGIEFHQAKAVCIHPEGNAASSAPYVTVEYTDPGRKGQQADLAYDYLINATGPKLNFGATKGLGPELHSHSVCTHDHAAKTSAALDELIARMRKGERKTLLIGTGHGTCTCQGAAFEYIFNVEFILRQHGVRDKARVIWISNEMELGDFGIGGMFLHRGGYVTHSRVFTESLYTERGIEWITQAHVQEVTDRGIRYELLDGSEHELASDFSMLLPPFAGVGLSAVDRQGADITSSLFAPSGFMMVDGDYAKKPYEEWKPSDWPQTYQSPKYRNIFAAGIAFAPPHAISKPMISAKGVPIFPAPPRTGMPTGVMARQVAYNIVDMIKGKADGPTRKASLAHMGAACIASAGANLFSGTAVSMTMYPIIPDFERYPDTGRDLRYTTGEIGLAGHWIKHVLHHAFIYKAKAKPFWTIIPE